jgi:acyl-CoA synthetase (AMP-forming)/AMP-acid ligase II
VHAVIALEKGVEPFDIEALRQRLSGQLSAYKLPRSLEFRDEIPRTDAGKLRRGSYRNTARS